MRLRSMCVVLCTAALVVSCSSDSKGSDLGLGTTATTQAPTSTTGAPQTTAAQTTVASTTTTTTTTEPPTTATTTPVPTDAPTTQAPPVTEAPTTTVELSAEDKVKADFDMAVEARHHCSYDPFTCDYASIAVAGSPMDVETREVVASRIRNNLRAVEGQGEVKIRIDGIGFEGASAFVTICAFDTVVIFDIADPANPNDDIIYDDSKASSKVRWEMRQTDGRWLLFASERLENLEDGDLCGF